MRVVILTNRQSNQVALANKIAGVAEVGAVVVSKNRPRKPADLPNRLLNGLSSVANRTVGREFVKAWNAVLERYYEQFDSFPVAQTVDVDNVNDEDTLRTVREVDPDLVVVSGTNIVADRLISEINRDAGILNLHTGISPYVKGGPNCTNWCLAKGWFHLIGNTVMQLDAGIDTGNIIATETTPLTGDEDLEALHWRVMEHAHDLYVRVIARIARGDELISVPQRSIAEGALFLNRHWNAAEMIRAKRNFARGFREYFHEQEGLRPALQNIQLVPLGDD